MALIILSPDEQSDIVIGTGGGFGNTVRAATGNELATIAANGVAEFDSSWTDGDTIRVLGDASEFTVEVSSSDLIFTSTSGGSFSVPIKATGATLVFDDASRQISVKDGDVCLGDQIIEGPAEAVDEGSNGSGGGGGGGGDGQTFLLDFTTDFLNGTDGDDTFNAPLSQNSTGSGEQANRLGTGDTLNGGGGNDQLLAVVQDASALNGAPSSPIAPFTVDIETAIFTAIAPTNYFESDTDYDYEDYTVEINAGAMIGLDVIGSGGYSPFPGLPAILNSDASLIIYNLTTLTDSGEYDDRRPTEELCIVMDHTGNGDQLLPAADLIVLFDQDYLFCDPNAPSGSQLFIEMMDLDAAIDLQTDDGVDNHGVGQGQTYQGPLDQVPFTQLTFDLDTDGDGVADETRTLDFGAYGDILSYEDLRDAVNQAIADAGPDYVNFTAVLQGQFIANDTDAQPGGSAVGDILVITNS